MTGARGEAIIETEDGEVRLLYTNRALMEAEKALGEGIFGVLDRFAEGSGGMNEVTVLLRAGMEAARRDAREGGKPVNMLQALSVLDEVGFVEAAPAIMEAVAAVISYSRNSGEEAEDDADPN